MNESWKYDSTAAFVAVADTTLLRHYASLAGALALLNASAAIAAVVPFTEPGGASYQRVSLGMAINGADNTTVLESLYLVKPSHLLGVEGVIVERVGTITWTSGGVQIPIAQGGVASYNNAKAAAIVSDGLLEARTGSVPAAISRAPASVEIPDVAEALALVRVVYRGSAAGALAFSSRWK